MLRWYASEGKPEPLQKKPRFGMFGYLPLLNDEHASSTSCFPLPKILENITISQKCYPSGSCFTRTRSLSRSKEGKPENRERNSRRKATINNKLQEWNLGSRGKRRSIIHCLRDRDSELTDSFFLGMEPGQLLLKHNSCLIQQFVLLLQLLNKNVDQVQ